MTLTLVRFAAAGLAALLLFAGAVPSRAADPYEIYVIAELTGFNAFVGNEEVKSILAVQDLVNKRGGINGRQIKMVVKDDQSNPQVAVQFMNEAMAHNVPIVFGGGVAATCLAMAGALKPEGPVLYCWSSGINPQAGGWIYSSAFAALDQMATGIRYMRERGAMKFAALTSSDATGQDADRNLGTVFGLLENRSTSLVSREHFNVSDISVGAQLARIKQSGAQGLIAWTTGTGFGTILRGLRDAGMSDLPVLTTGGNMSYQQMEAYKDIIPQTLLFSVIPAVVPEAVTDPRTKRAVADFVGAFKPQGIRPDVGYAVSWDGTFLVLGAFKKYGFNATPVQIRDYINEQTNDVGSFGPMNFKLAPQRGLTKDTIIVARWDAQRDRWIAVSRPGGYPRS